LGLLLFIFFGIPGFRYAVYRDTGCSVRWLCNAAIAAPVLSPAAVLALHLMSR